MRPVILLLVATVFTGCSARDAGVEAAEATPPAAAEGEVAGASPEPSLPAARGSATFTEFFAYEGTTATAACVPSGPGSCMGLPVPTQSENTFVALEYTGLVNAVDATVTWEAATPATATMVASVFAVRSCGDHCFESDDTMYRYVVSGASPLVVAAKEIELREGEDLILGVHVQRAIPSTHPVLLFYSLEQPFSVDGSVTSLVVAST